MQGRRWIRRLAAVTFGLVVAFACAEVTLRLTQPPVDLGVLTGKAGGKNPMAEWAQVDAFCAYRARPGPYREGKAVNRHGFISTPELDLEKPAGTVRIAFLGGSSTACNELPDEETWPWRTVERLRAALPGRRIELLNAALGGFTSFESFGRLWSRVRFFRPDFVVVYHGWNELYYFRDASSAARWRVREDGSWGFDQPVQRIRIRPRAIDPWIEWSSLLCRIRRQWFSEPLDETGEALPLAADFDPDAPAVFRDQVRLFVAAEHALGFELAFVKQATLVSAALPPELRKYCHYELHGFDHEAHVRAFGEVYRAIDEEVPPEHVIDATPLNGNKAYFLDHIHLTRDGADAVAAIVADHLAARVRAQG